MNTKLINEVAGLMDDLDKNSEGLDKKTLFEAVQLTEADYSEPVDGNTMIAELTAKGLL
ncbi:hypothetical protein [Acinetobacter sp.]|uniref:hypothetical protein n=1 Tax=Acinetobacter sp. TaxID=472 RepID=UPI0038900EE0